MPEIPYEPHIVAYVGPRDTLQVALYGSHEAACVAVKTMKEQHCTVKYVAKVVAEECDTCRTAREAGKKVVKNLPYTVDTL